MVGRINLKMLAIVVSLTTILFAQEEILTFIPNVQLTFLLVCCYGATVGLGYGTMIIGIHVILDNIVMGSLTPFIMIPQFIGLFIALLFGYLFRNKNEYIQAIFSAIAVLLYSWAFIPFNIFYFNVKFIPYLIADIPFELILVVTSLVTIILLYKPIVTTINRLMENMIQKEPINNLGTKTNNNDIIITVRKEEDENEKSRDNKRA